MIEIFYCASEACPRKDSCYKRKEKLLSHINSEWETLAGEDCYPICSGSRLYTTSYDKVSNYSAQLFEGLI